MTSELAHARTNEGLRDVVDQLHDWWFDLDDFHWDAGSQQAWLMLYPTAPAVRAELASRRRLLIRNVSAVVIDDEARIGHYDLNTLTSRGDTLVLESGFPLRVSCQLTGPLDVLVFEED